MTTRLFFNLDPTGHYQREGAQVDRLAEAAGIIPHFFASALERAHHNEQAPTLGTIGDIMSELYGFGGFVYAMGGTVTEDGVYQYEGDDDLYPYGEITGEGLTLRVYPYAITALTDGQRTITGRFD
ncbi:MAG: hypothetical protein RLZZ602_1320 [Pseudomonadota bacterium]|jgi:hypothetical protein